MAVAIRNRVKELRHVKASELIPNEKNWRKHPQPQRDALAGLLREIGFAGATLARETPDGLVLLDGHLRRDLLPDQEIPVLVTDLDEAEANLLLASYDPLSAMAEADAAKLDALLREVNTGSAALQEMLAGILEAEKSTTKNGDGESVHEQAVQLRPSREYVVIYADSSDEWDAIKSKLSLQHKRRGGYKVGSAFDAVSIERVIPASRFLKAGNADSDSV